MSNHTKPKNWTDSQATDFVTSLSSNTSPYKTFLPVVIHNKGVKAMMDSGNTFANVMSLDLYTSLGLDASKIIPLHLKKPVKSANSTTLEILGYAPQKLRLQIGTCAEVIKIRPVIVKNLACNLNLSGPFLAALNITHNYGAQEIIYKGKVFPLTTQESADISHLHTHNRAYLAHSVTVPPHSRIFTTARVPAIAAGFMKAHDGLIEGSPDFETNTNLHTWRAAAVKPSDAGLIPVGLMNTTSQPISIGRGAAYGVFSLLCDARDPQPGYISAIFPGEHAPDAPPTELPILSSNNNKKQLIHGRRSKSLRI